MYDKKYLISAELTVKETISYMETNSISVVLIVDEERHLKGLFSMGDMRRFFLSNGSLSQNITVAMNPTPIVFESAYEANECTKNLVLYPVVDAEKRVVNIIDSSHKEVCSDVLQNVPVVIMAGGKGTRLYPYTKVLPKALIPIGESTISERIIQSFQRFGCNDFYMVLNHKAGMIRAYFSELDKNYNISFVQEEKFLGTGGGLAYLKGMVDNTFFFSNCDILIDADLECIYKTHKANGNKITFVCAMKDVTIPYGVVETDTCGNILALREKPEFSFLTNTGLYVVEPDVITGLKENEFIHMPDIAQRYLDAGEKVGIFPIQESCWMDMGQFSEMESMMNRLGIQG